MYLAWWNEAAGICILIYFCYKDNVRICSSYTFCALQILTLLFYPAAYDFLIHWSICITFTQRVDCGGSLSYEADDQPILCDIGRNCQWSYRYLLLPVEKKKSWSTCTELSAPFAFAFLIQILWVVVTFWNQGGPWGTNPEAHSVVSQFTDLNHISDQGFQKTSIHVRFGPGSCIFVQKHIKAAELLANPTWRGCFIFILV